MQHIDEKKRKQINNDLQNTIQKTKVRAPRTLLKTRGLTQVLWKGMKFLLHMCHPSC